MTTPKIPAAPALPTVAGSTASVGPIVETTSGPVRGAGDGHVHWWKGIPYAAPPIGDLRWRAPQPASSWTAVRDASRFGAAPVQTTGPAVRLPDDVERSEDCLTLNVWAADSVAPGDDRPVVVWIHGGAYVFGSTSQRLYDGRTLTASGEIVLVTVGYRLGTLGFLDLSRFGDEGEFEPNVALKDVVAALEWVRANIRGFGGDPEAVTLAGESAGAGIVTTLMASPAARGLFHRAIAESSPATSVYDQDRAERVTRHVLDELGVAPADAAALRRMPADTLAAAGMTVYSQTPVSDPGTLAFTPVVDGDLVPEHPVDVFVRGGAHPVPLLIGTNHDETSLFTRMKSPLMPVSPEALAQMTAALRAERTDIPDIPTDAEIQVAYAGLAPARRGPAISRDLGFRMPTLWLVEGHAAVAPTYLYRFDWATPMLHLLRIGATHATELPYLWGNMVGGRRDITFLLGGLHTGRLLGARMQARWIAFATGAAPDAGEADAAWPAYDPDSRATLVIDHTDRLEPDLDAPLREAWGDTPLSFS
ncbi:carboxylesterase/lipase family protein [Microbacterium sp. LRZ72]|uniref:carboxylesterase/lipase family protein n=1 Tax=Microbacterium sp. LRZ72 TaxID=2942481 RepID=UPI0029ADD2D8|nr:carboxylesterase/lipase family protein [Microbacterium sp. LRZ72]MDX2375753.1 carboxylesterase/lipase family protein [Microbacterium sp. LRZ72]